MRTSWTMADVLVSRPARRWYSSTRLSKSVGNLMSMRVVGILSILEPSSQLVLYMIVPYNKSVRFRDVHPGGDRYEDLVDHFRHGDIHLRCDRLFFSYCRV